MRTFAGMNKMGGSKCPVCNTDKDGEVVLIAIAGTQEGFNSEAAQFHMDCLEPIWDRERGFIYQFLGRPKPL